MRCNLCDKQKSKLLFRKDGYDIRECSNCSLVFVSPQPTPEELKNFYSKIMFTRGNKYDYKLVNRKLIYNERVNDVIKLKFMKKYIGSGKLLDVGCANGFFLYLSKRYYDGEGVEYSSSAVKVAKSLGVKVTEGEISTIKKSRKERYDIITMWDVIEHLRDPSKALRHANGLLKKGGYMFLSTGDISAFVPKLFGKSWALMTPPMHLFFFSRKTIVRMLKKNGFHVKDIKYFGKKMELGWAIFKLADSSDSRLLRFIHNKLKDTWLMKLKIHINTFDIMTVVAVKR